MKEWGRFFSIQHPHGSNIIRGTLFCCSWVRAANSMEIFFCGCNTAIKFELNSSSIHSWMLLPPIKLWHVLHISSCTLWNRSMFSWISFFSTFNHSRIKFLIWFLASMCTTLLQWQLLPHALLAKHHVWALELYYVRWHCLYTDMLTAEV